MDYELTYYFHEFFNYYKESKNIFLYRFLKSFTVVVRIFKVNNRSIQLSLVIL